MNDILEHPLVLKYFSPSPGELIPCDDPRNFCLEDWRAVKVLQAMQKPVKKGELYLAISEYGDVRGPVAFTSSDVWKFHCQWLRLPDRFQPLSLDAQVEEKINEIIEFIRVGSRGGDYMLPELRALVELARKGK